MDFLSPFHPLLALQWRHAFDGVAEGGAVHLVQMGGQIGAEQVDVALAHLA